MKTTRIILAGILASFVFGINAQNSVADVKAISDKVSANCGTPVWGQDSVKAVTNYSLYREFKKQGENQSDLATKVKYYKDAHKGWIYVYYNAPSARVTTHLDGADIYEAFIEATTDEALKEKYIDSLLAIYDTRANCFGSTADLTMRKAFAWYSNRNKGNEEYVYSLFNETVAAFDSEEGTSKMNMSPAFLAPWMIMAIKANKVVKSIEEEEVFEVFDVITEISDFNMAAGNNAGQYKGALDKCYEYMDKYKYLDPAKISEIATKKYNENPKDLATQIKVYKMLKAAKLYDDPIFFTVAEGVYQAQPSAALATFLAKRASENKNYTKAIQYMQEANEMETDSDVKAKNLLNIAQFYQMKGDFSSARSYAYKAAEMKTGWGDPYILIGRLYAASGPKCGSGTGWDSQVVVWAAIDMWTKAKSVDAGVAGEAQELINKYYQYMPSKSDIFLRPDISVGSSYSIGCWMGVTTTVRSSD
ncbi:MAG: tetratricopeptide repeat protein [Chitinophagales bacterium]|nr:tetratricopeptide repeat protein [Bacteroidota bacterium]MCB9255734.1 tetratricopeptide repeat protein [Chitinophagales bacterium]